MRNPQHLALAALLALAAAQPARAQLFGGVLNGVTSVVNQVGNKVGAKLTADKPQDVEAERARFLDTLERQLAGIDAATRARLREAGAAQWSMAETALLLKNAQLKRQEDGPLVDFGLVAREAAGGVSTQLGMNSIFGTGSVGEVIGSAALDGLVAGASGTASANPQALRAQAYGAGMPGAALGAGVNAAVAGGVGNSIATLMRRTLAGKEPAYAFPDGADPRSFLGRQPGQLYGKDLYRENGFIGWKRIDGAKAQGAQAYAPVMGDDDVAAAVFDVDPRSGAVHAAFRVLKVAPVDFAKVVAGLEAKLQQKAVYAGSGDTLRAVWSDGSFVTADATRVCVGWSALAAGHDARVAR